jgi:hypothetical protein
VDLETDAATRELILSMPEGMSRLPVLLFADGTRMQTDDLTIPHPRMWERGFGLAPLRDVAPDLVDAGDTWEGVREAGVTLHPPPVA